jgi:tryptophan synthase alpha chain
MRMTENRIDTTLGALRSAGKTVLVPFITVGFPDVDTSEALAEVIAGSGADMLELGVPFSDPLADGPTIQMTSFRALQQGVTVRISLQVVRNLRAKGVEVPLIFMGYYNPFLRYGVEQFVRDAADAGLDGLIVPDLPTEEVGPFKSLCERHGIYVTPLLAPTSTDRRIELACKDANGFIYCVGVTGVTGARRGLTAGISELVARVRLSTDLPILVGFGVAERRHVEEISRFADGAVVGSALLDAIDKSPPDRVLDTARQFVTGLKTGEGG